MSACYSVTLKIKGVKNEAAAIARLKEFIVNEKNTDFGLDDFKGIGVTDDTLDGIIQIVLAGWKDSPFKKSQEEGGVIRFDNGFNASYGWESVMIDFFNALGLYLDDGSSFYISVENDYDEAVVRQGAVIWIH